MKTSTSISPSYRPELKATTELIPEDISQFQSLIGISRWAVDLGRIGITCEVSMMYSHIEITREVHVQQVYHIFSNLRQHHNSRLVFAPN